jgi:hypothetical protein
MRISYSERHSDPFARVNLTPVDPGWNGIYQAECPSLVCLIRAEPPSPSPLGTSAETRHIIDSQSWPLDLAAFPELAEKGAYSKEKRYSEDDIRWIVAYAGKVSLQKPETKNPKPKTED